MTRQPRMPIPTKIATTRDAQSADYMQASTARPISLPWGRPPSRRETWSSMSQPRSMRAAQEHASRRIRPRRGRRERIRPNSCRDTHARPQPVAIATDLAVAARRLRDHRRHCCWPDSRSDSWGGHHSKHPHHHHYPSHSRLCSHHRARSSMPLPRRPRRMKIERIATA